MWCIRNQKGQALLIVVLAMVVALTVGLSVVSRSIINLKNTQEEINSQKALSAAEAGVEQAIKSNLAFIGENSLSSASYNVSIATVSGQTAFLLNGYNKVSQDDAVYIWLTPYSDDSTKLFQDTDALGHNARWSGNLTIYWGYSINSCNNSAIQVVVISGSRASPIAQRYAFDPCSTRRSENNFSSPTSVSQPIGDVTLYNSTGSIAVSNGFLARVIPLYNSSYIGVNAQSAVGSPALPVQGSIISSIGKSDNNTIQRQLNVFQGYPEMPAEFFPFSIFWP